MVSFLTWLAQIGSERVHYLLAIRIRSWLWLTEFRTRNTSPNHANTSKNKLAQSHIETRIKMKNTAQLIQTKQTHGKKKLAILSGSSGSEILAHFRSGWCGLCRVELRSLRPGLSELDYTDPVLCLHNMNRTRNRNDKKKEARHRLHNMVHVFRLAYIWTGISKKLSGKNEIK